MASLVAEDVTITTSTVTHKGGRREVEVSVAFGDGIDTYPSGGVPMPTRESWGMVERLSDFFMTDASNALGNIYKYDKTNNKIRIYEQGFRTGSTSTTTNENGALAEGGVDGLTEVDIRLPKTSINTTYQLGALKEFTATSKPAAVTLKGYAYGW